MTHELINHESKPLNSNLIKLNYFLFKPKLNYLNCGLINLNPTQTKILKLNLI